MTDLSRRTLLKTAAGTTLLAGALHCLRQMHGPDARQMGRNL